MLSLRTHNILDYVGAAILVLSPYIFGFADVDAARNTFLVLGFGLAGYSLLTNYYYSIVKAIPLGVHMFLDVVSGIILMLAPAMFNYRGLITDGQYALHFVLGIGVVALVAVTRRRTETGSLAGDISPSVGGRTDTTTGLGRTGTDRRDRVGF